MTNAQKYLLAALAAAPGGALSPVQTQKAMFVLGQEAENQVGKDFYQFVPYNYGPFCRSIYDDIAVFAMQGLVTVDNSSKPSRYIITKTGLEVASQADIPQQLSKYLSAVVGWVAGQSFSQLLNSVYSKYPDFAVNSVFSR